ncbi:MAG TPA: SDR family oxidoreductase [Sphingobacteriaceae bacterium]
MSTILILGATGTTGQQVLQRLADIPDIRLRAATRHPEANHKVNAAEYVKFDYTEKATIEKAIKGVQKVFLVTPFVPELFEYEKAVIDAVKDASVEHIVKVSVTGAEDRHGTAIGKIHGNLESLISETGIPYTFLRPFSFMQNFSNHASYTIRSQNAFYQPAGDGKINSIDTRDIAAVAAKALTENGHEGKAYTLTGPEPLSNARVAEILSSVTGREIKYIDIPEDQARRAMREAGMP